MQKKVHFVRKKSPQLLPVTRPKSTNKILLLLLKRKLNQTLKTSFDALNNYSTCYRKKLHYILRICGTNNQIFLHLGWSKLKMFVKNKKMQQRFIKNVVVLTKRIERAVLMNCFNKICTNNNQTNPKAYEKIVSTRKIILWQLLKKIYIQNKKDFWNKLKYNKKLLNKVNHRIISLYFIFLKIYNQNLSYSFTKLVTHKTSQFSQQNTCEIQNLYLQLQDMKIQAYNKNQNISRLYQQITELKQHSIIKSGDTSSFMICGSFGNLSRSNSKNMFYEKDKQSNEGNLSKEKGYGSNGLLFSYSAINYKSKDCNSNQSLNLSKKVQSCLCKSCIYRQKYQKYKITTQTLKKQLDIIKAELDFTKDMNQHMEKQLNSHHTNRKHQYIIDKLKLQLKQSHNQRQNLKDKVSKYQKYVDKLKLEFKGKIQQIYRKVKKNY